MKTFGPRTRISPLAGSILTSLKAAAGPMEPGLIMPPAGTPVDKPPVSVIPQTSSIGTPRARYHFTKSGEIGAAPVIRYRARWMPRILRTLFSAIQRASVNWNLSQALTGCPAITRSAICAPTWIPQP